MNQLYVYMYSLPGVPIPSLYRSSLTEHWAELPGLCRIFPLALCFTHGSIYLSVLLSWFIPVLSVCVSILALQVHSHILKLHLSLPLKIWLCPINRKVWKLPLPGPFILSPSLIKSKGHDSCFDNVVLSFIWSWLVCVSSNFSILVFSFLHVVS